MVGFLGAPNSGKTVAATSMFARLKKQNIAAVYVPEFAHEKVVEGNSTALANQIFVWATQQYRIFSAYRHAQVVVTDSPILLGAIYNLDAESGLHQVILAEHRRYNNLNIVMELDDSYPYNMVGRIHDFEQSQDIEQRILQLLQVHDLPFVRYSETTEDELVDLITDAISY